MGGVTHLQERTVRSDGTIKWDGGLYAGRGEFDRNLLREWKGKRVFVQQNDYWGVELRASTAKFMTNNIARLRLCD